ncbi:MAG TPA: hypothetical protein PLP19_16815 [bacterium]|nr:hypothetical protein [bacterium]HPN45156.1 hypothetical protein [bacterium]
MKKLILLLFVLVFAGFVLAASNSSSINQTGKNHQATTTQTGSSNTSTVDQTKTDYTYYSSGITATVQQTGNNNWSDVDQYRGAYGGSTPSQAVVNQLGDMNISDINQNVNDYALANVGQTGSFNEAYINQLRNQSTGTITQTGDDHYANQHINGSVLGATIIQSGNGGGGDNGMGNEAWQVLGSGTVNDHSSLSATQTGIENYSNQIMAGGQWGWSHTGGNQGFVVQSGNNNTAEEYMDKSATTPGSENNYSIITQTGDWNTAQSFQYGNAHNASTTQTGNNNNAVIKQTN